MTVEELKKISSFLTPKDKLKVASKFKVSKPYVSMILQGKRYNFNIIEELSKIALRNSVRKNNRLEKVKNNIKKLK